MSRKILPALLLLALLWSSGSIAQVTKKIITAEDKNVRSTLTYCPDSGEVLLAWFRQKDAQTVEDNSINAALLNPDSLHVRKAFDISTSNKNRYNAPYFGVVYNQDEQQFLYVYQLISQSSRTLVATTTDQRGNVLQNAEILDAEAGVLVSPVLLTPGPAAARNMAFVTELKENEIITRALEIDINRPAEEFIAAYTWPGKPLFYLLPQSALVSKKRVFLYSFAQFPKVEEQRYISRLIFLMERRFGGMKLVVLRNRKATGLDGATTLSAILGQDDTEDVEMLVYDNQTDGSIDGLSYDTTIRQTLNRERLTAEGLEGLEAVVCGPAADGSEKVVWIEKDGPRHSIKVASITELMDVVPSTQSVIHTHPTQRLSSLAATFDDEGKRLFVSWSVHLVNGSTRLHVAAMDF